MNGLRRILFIVFLFLAYSYCDYQFEEKYEGLLIKRIFAPSEEATPEYEDEILRTKPIIIPLGSNCFQAWILRDMGLRFLAYPFDWNVSALSAVYRLIENDFVGLCDKKLFARSGLSFVRHKRYNILFPHDFHVRENYSDAEYQDDLEKTIRRYEKRIARFYKAVNSGRPVCFIRASSDVGYLYFSTEVQITKNWCENFVALLKTKFPKLVFTLICSDYTGEIRDAWGISNCINFYYDLSKWPPDFVLAERDWKRKLEELGFGG